jgi:hypothetical protein
MGTAPMCVITCALPWGCGLCQDRLGGPRSMSGWNRTWVGEAGGSCRGYPYTLPRRPARREAGALVSGGCAERSSCTEDSREHKFSIYAHIHRCHRARSGDRRLRRVRARVPRSPQPGDSLDELHANLREVIAMLLEDGEPQLEAEFVGTQTILVA